MVKKRLLDHLTYNSLLNPFQSAYTKFYSNESTLLSLHDYLCNAISMQQVSCLCLLDLSAAFDTLDHSILLHRLSTWFVISSVSLQWFTSYLSSRTSTVGIPTPLHTVPLHPLLPAEFHKASSSAQFFSIFILLFVALLIVILLSLTSYMLMTHISFVPKNFSSAINNLQTTIALISSLMSSNYLTLNPSKTEFLRIGLPQQTSKIVIPSLYLPTIKPIMTSLSVKISVSYLTRHCLSQTDFIPLPRQ